MECQGFATELLLHPQPSLSVSDNRQKPQTKSHEPVGDFELTEGYIHDFYFILVFAGLYSSAAYCDKERKPLKYLTITFVDK